MKIYVNKIGHQGGMEFASLLDCMATSLHIITLHLGEKIYISELLQQPNKNN